MESSTKQTGRQPRPEEPKPSDQLPPDAPDALQEAADTPPGARPFDAGGPSGGAEAPAEVRAEGARKESAALDFILGSPKPLSFNIPVTVNVPGGRDKQLLFVIRQLDGQRIMALEEEHRSSGAGPFTELDEPNFNAAMCAEAVQRIIDKETGAEVDPTSKEFIGQWVSPLDAFRNRFRFQSGVLAGVTARIRIVSGYANDRVGAAERPIRDAVGNS